MDKNALLKQAMQKRAGLSSILMGLPVIGGAAHGLIDPVEGSPRGTSLFYEGGGGLLGSLLGALGGGAALRDDETGVMSPWGMAGGGILGSVGGSLLGRWLAQSKDSGDPEMEELRKLVEKLSERGVGLSRDSVGGGITINVGPTQAREEENWHGR